MEKAISGDGASGTVTLVKGDNLITLEATVVGATTELILQSRTDAAGIWCDHVDPVDATKLAKITVANVTTGGAGYGRHFVLTGPGELRAWAVNFTGTSGAKLRALDAQGR